MLAASVLRLPLPLLHILPQQQTLLLQQMLAAKDWKPHLWQMLTADQQKPVPVQMLPMTADQQKPVLVQMLPMTALQHLW